MIGALSRIMPWWVCCERSLVRLLQCLGVWIAGETPHPILALDVTQVT